MNMAEDIMVFNRQILLFFIPSKHPSICWGSTKYWGRTSHFIYLHGSLLL